MSAPDEMVEAVRDVVRVWLDGTDAGRFTNDVARAVLSVPALAEVIARDAKVREIAAETSEAMQDESDQPMSYTAADGFDAIAALYPEAGK